MQRLTVKIWQISIPQGSIKSLESLGYKVAFGSFQFHKVRLKVSQLQREWQRHGQFQFHKVRLKGGREIPRMEDLPISIPQGSIKRSGAGLSMFYLQIFQFHKVRLKVVHCSETVAPGGVFQFHKVRLKEKNRPGVRNSLSYFNSTRFD